MLPVERQNRIRELITKQHNMKISELSKILGVSEMTVHRDVKTLIDEGYVTKTFGGITLRNEESDSALHHCVICHKRIEEKLAYRLILPESKIETACCAHCGLIRHAQLQDQVVQAICYDFLNQTTISAPLASYVMNTSIDMGCCQPQVLTFNLKEHAVNFVKGFGGNVYSFKDAMDINNKNMAGEGCHHTHPTS